MCRSRSVLRLLGFSLFISLTIGTLLADAQVFISAPRVNTGGDPGKPYFGDFNGDGHIDIVVAAYPALKILLGNGDGTFQAAHQFGSSGSIAVGDFNGDGKLDVAGTVSGGISIYAGRGNGTFTTLGTVTANSPAVVRAADMNGDGKVDLIFSIASRQLQGIGVLLSNGDGTFQPEVDTVFDRSATDVQIGDFNSDGKPDVVGVLRFSYAKTTIRVLIGNGDGTLQAPIDSLVQDTAGTAALADFDGDGHLDVVVDGDNSNTMIVLFGTGDGHLRNSRSVAVGEQPRGVVAADFNGDGKSDIASVNYTDNSVSVVLGLGTGGFRGRVDYAAGEQAYAISVGDINGDGKPDLMTPLSVACCEAGAIAAILNNGDGTFYSGRMYDTGVKYPTAVAAGDLNGDGSPDIVVGTAGKSVTVLIGNGDGSFGGPHLFSTTQGSVGVAMGDFNNDGKLDVACACDSYGSGASTMSLLLGNGDGTLQTPIDVNLPHLAQGIVVGDLNRDGNLDAIVVERVIGSGPGDFVLLLGNGDGTFQPSQTYNTGGSFGNPFVAIADVNSDGKPDILVAQGNSVATLLGRGDGTFKSRMESPAGNTVYSITTGDLDGDGNTDVVSVGSGGGAGGSVGIMFGNGDGTFRALVKYASARGPSSPSVADFNQDGFVDVAATNIYGTVSTWLNNGDGTLQPHVDYAVGNYSEQNAVADFNGDGYPDLVVANSGAAFAHNVTVLLNKGNLPRK